ncbi:hypothetical protein IMG5_077590 [Ichthyophthirius multifiliis]|uniref:Uncharacterized protein n=1 Tax=Ichthyophthirius multifiliis TaxID=5932 RepID=G0QQE0_ICHMU|nr:hypothetical protein IMG5_077590 [Ichthyophthirius multifiliis]EGR32565.1 hypothetical protein IMG5_077590 [Ichthyophthirius multifiliis]|eukprot:XP_004036551.1 hypothetical protein IMG5_077590 [Ichthyophthirius multifiliis]
MITLQADQTTPLSVSGILINAPPDFSSFINVRLYLDGVPEYYPSCSQMKQLGSTQYQT